MALFTIVLSKSTPPADYQSTDQPSTSNQYGGGYPYLINVPYKSPCPENQRQDQNGNLASDGIISLIKDQNLFDKNCEEAMTGYSRIN
ncbi:hypothetical protein EAI_08249 [Harpegnathos saltator]|uniref:Uncharacterized protein n=1 Tax=Harpegnathos saltator TaxID=610380 RepID=E2BEG0_HARSA|nr:hypothetical protein EAI_08249 [Harpegnathos saltator]